jgi:glycosyltransferase involved in cell wall biosynthesis
MLNITHTEKASVIVSTFNRCAILKNVLYSLNEQTIPSDRFEIIVCDSHSGDGTREMIDDFKRVAKHTFFHGHTTNNIGAKRNMGIKKASHNIVILLDDDCVPESNFVASHVENFHTLGVGIRRIYCGEVRYPTKFVASSNYYRFRDSRHFGYSKPYSYPASLDYKTIVTMNMCFEKDLFLSEVGGVDESFVGYGAEDQELGWRLQEQGYEILPCPARIAHFETTGSISAYGSKIMRASRDGMNTLLRVNPEAAFGISALRKLDPAFPNRSLVEKTISSLVYLFIRLHLHSLMERVLNKTDHISWLYFPALYRILMGAYYVQGIYQRPATLTADQAEFGWEGSSA